MHNLIHAIWHPFLHFRRLAWFAAKGRWLLIAVPVVVSLMTMFKALDMPLASNIVLDAFIIRLMILVIEKFIFKITETKIHGECAPYYSQRKFEYDPTPQYFDLERGTTTSSQGCGSIRIN